MRTSISDIIRTEKFLRDEFALSERLAFETRLIADANLRSGLFFHRMVHRLVTLYHRRKIRKEIDALHKRLFECPEKTEFRDSVTKIFNY